MKVFGPYLRESDQRQIVVIQYNNGKRKTMTYARYLKQCEEGILLPDETVDHIDNDKTNDNIDNFQLLSRAENTAKENRRRGKK